MVGTADTNNITKVMVLINWKEYDLIISGERDWFQNYIKMQLTDITTNTARSNETSFSKWF